MNVKVFSEARRWK